MIAKVYEEVEKTDVWCAKAEPLVEAAILTTEEFSTDLSPTLGGITTTPRHLHILVASPHRHKFC